MANDGSPDSPSRKTPEARYPTAVDVAGEEAVRNFIAALDPVGSRIPPLILNTVFEELHADPVLSHGERELITLAVLAALGGTTEQIELHLGIAHRLGISPERVIAVFTHTGPYAGFPRALNAIEAAKDYYGRLGLLPL
ncbi:carboxymuconolactone decarboxylase family protein [Streptomyces fumanus]|uniref:carboxymuconolactone decarboxylase family protein n=1 Tax=Streptomyces fumanus TaxID=67302 RepID=UPI0033E6A6C1